MYLYHSMWDQIPHQIELIHLVYTPDQSKAFTHRFSLVFNIDNIFNSILNHLVTNSELEVWYYGLNAATRTDWKLFEMAFKANWPRETVATVTLAEKRAKLMKESWKLRMCWSLQWWMEWKWQVGWSGLGRLDSCQPRPRTRRELSSALCMRICLIFSRNKHMKAEYKDWDEFIKEAQDVKELDIWQSLKEDDRIVALKWQLSE